jgi:hypothetical protein
MGQRAAVRALSEEVLSAVAEAKETPAKAIATASDEAAILRAGLMFELSTVIKSRAQNSRYGERNWRGSPEKGQVCMAGEKERKDLTNGL